MENYNHIFKINPSGIKPRSGKLLIAGPFLHDYYFGRSVILITEHEENGSMGFIVNKPTEFFVADLIEGFPDMDMPLFSGGPVQNDNVFILHRRPDLIDNGSKIFNNIYWGGDFDQIKDLLKNGMLSPTDIRFFLGYSGWGDDQLKEEIKNESWIIGNINKDIDIFSYTGEDMWVDIIKSFGDKYIGWLKFPANPSDN